MDVGDSAFEMPTNASSSNNVWELSSPLANTIDISHASIGPGDPSFHTSFKVRQQSQHSGNEPDNILLCVGFRRDQCVGLDVVILNEFGDPVADDICRKSEPRECVDANPLGLDDVGVCILNSLLPSELPLTWRFSLRRWPLHCLLHEE